jgi:predicted O-methyltransferase YrrM
VSSRNVRLDSKSRAAASVIYQALISAKASLNAQEARSQMRKVCATQPLFNLDYAEVIDDVVDGSLDFIVVDGHFREACLRRAVNKLRPGGLLIIDNTDVLPETLLDSLRTADSYSWNNGISETTVIRL